MTTDPTDRADDPWQRRWTWDQRPSPRWLLVGFTGTPQFPGMDAMALCADVEGVFARLDLKSAPSLT